MGQPGRLKACHPMHIGGKRGELKHLSTHRKSPNRRCYGTCGVVGLRYRMKSDERKELESSAREGESPVPEV